MRKIVIVSDFQDGWPPAQMPPSRTERIKAWTSQRKIELAQQETRSSPGIQVEGGYLERLPLACIACGLVDHAEIWSHWRPSAPPPRDASTPCLTRRFFQLNDATAPFASNDMLAHIEVFGPPDILCVWGLGVAEDVLIACETSFKIYNSIDAPALRIPTSLSARFDLILTGAEWQSREVERLHPHMKTAVLPIGPEFASASMFFPIPGPKLYDVIYVAAAQPYKRHDILFSALAKLPRTVSGLCVCGYGENGERLRHQAADLGLAIDFVGPPGVPAATLNRLINQAKIGIVCGVDDGAPAVLTEYMLAGLPVLANSELRCGRQYITPQTGSVASADEFHFGILRMLSRLSSFTPRDTVLKRWTWQHSIKKLRGLIQPRASGTDAGHHLNVDPELKQARM
ncbi:glycosyltransferase [Rhizobium giardinii]|uniref:glycosyltransferase n=1 Tax=Rhizobium giardinii TaxID=56731 RepID=UPI000DD8CCCC